MLNISRESAIFQAVMLQGYLFVIVAITAAIVKLLTFCWLTIDSFRYERKKKTVQFNERRRDLAMRRNFTDADNWVRRREQRERRELVRVK